MNPEYEVLSYFEYPQPDGTRVKRYIEPLHGIARHPRCICGSHNLWDLTYLLPENACTASGNRVKGSLSEFSRNLCTFCPTNRSTMEYHMVAGFWPLVIVCPCHRCVSGLGLWNQCGEFRKQRLWTGQQLGTIHPTFLQDVLRSLHRVQRYLRLGGRVDWDRRILKDSPYHVWPLFFFQHNIL